MFNFFPMRLSHIAPVLIATNLSCGIIEKNKDKARDAKDTVDLVGVWTTRCKTKDFLLARTFQREQIQFTVNKNFTKQIIKHEDDDCKDERIRTTISGSYERLGEAKEVEDGKDINFTIKNIRVTSFTNEMTDALNNATYCGVDNWRTDKERNVTGRDCVGQPLDRGDVLYDVYKIENGKLFFGKTFLGFDEPVKLNLRPESLDTAKAYRRR